MEYDMHNLTRENENGLIEIFDGKDHSFQHFLKTITNATTVLHFIQYGQEGACSDIKQIHLVNCSSVIYKVVKFLKPFLKRELYEKLHIHQVGSETLYDFIDKECLPIEYGGCDGHLIDHVENTLKNLQTHRDYVSDDKNFFLLTE
jgi:hypothetical protein